LACFDIETVSLEQLFVRKCSPAIVNQVKEDAKLLLDPVPLVLPFFSEIVAQVSEIVLKIGFLDKIGFKLKFMIGLHVNRVDAK